VHQLETFHRGTEAVIIATDGPGEAWFDAAGQRIEGFNVGSHGFSACDWPTHSGGACLLTVRNGQFEILSDMGALVGRLSLAAPLGTDFRGAGFQARDGRWGFAVTATMYHYSLVSVYDLQGTLLHKERHPAGPISGVLPLPLSDGGGFAYGVGTAIRRITWTGVPD
jgi:hypothetical protein